VFLWFFSLAPIFGGGNSQDAPSTPPKERPALFPARDKPPEEPAGLEPAVEVPPSQETLRAEQVMKALAAAYPERLGRAEFRDGDWAVQLRENSGGGSWYYYAGGRLLPEELKDQAAQYDPQPFYNYPAELPPWQAPDAEAAARFTGLAERRRLHPPKRSQHFFDALWRARSRDESWDRVKSMRFLGLPVMVHYSILEELALVEERILEAAKTDAPVKQWIDSLVNLEGWNWRSIAETQSRSFHAYGAAMDLLPRSLGGRETYWLWAGQRNLRWWDIPYENRFHPPQAVIKAFEEQGFIWGGKWLFFDTMHFEYRPEILILNNLRS
jgi:hypothetical protein